MAKALKIICSIIAIVIIALILMIFIITKVINPNNYAPRIEQLVYKKTGRVLNINGQLQWSLFPWLGLDISQVSINNPSNIKGPNLATIKNLKFKIRLLPLLLGKVEVNEINLNQASINLIVNANNQNNWSQWHHSKVIKPTSSHPKLNTTHNIPIRSLTIAKLSITNSDIYFINQKAKSQLNMQHLNFSIKNFDSNKNFPIQLNYQITNPESGSSIKTQLNAIGNINLLTHEIALPKIQIKNSIDRPHLPTLKINLAGKMRFNPNQQTLDLTHLSIALSNLDLSGEIHGQQLFSMPHIDLTLTSTDTNLDKLMKNLQGTSNLSGTLHLETDLKMAGNTQQQMLHNLAGTGSVNVNDGAIQGINVSYLLAQASAYINKQPQPPEPKEANETRFSKLSAHYLIQNGILSNNDLVLNAGQLTVNGKGTINLINNTMNYQLVAQTNTAQFSLPILITGPTDHPRIIPNFSAIAKNYIKDQIKDYIKQEAHDLGKTLNNLFNHGN